MSREASESADYSRAAQLTVCPATPDDLPEIVRVYMAAYAQPPWCERNDPTQSRMYLEWLLGIPDSQCLVVTDAAAAGNGADRVRGMVMSAPRTPAEFYEDWERICHPLPQGWPRLPTATNAIGYIYEFAVDPPWQGRRAREAAARLSPASTDRAGRRADRLADQRTRDGGGWSVRAARLYAVAAARETATRRAVVAAPAGMTGRDSEHDGQQTPSPHGGEGAG